MSCKTGTNLEGLRHPSRFRAVPNEGEELFALSLGVFEKELNRLREEGFKYDKKGHRDQANLRYKAGNIYIYLTHYALFIRNKLKREGKFETCYDYCYFKIDCVESNLMCLSKNYGTDYVTAWKKLKEVYGINSNENCDCCQGVSGMVIGDQGECLPFEVGPCDTTTETETSEDEF